MSRERKRENPLPAPDTSTVEHRDVGYVVLGANGKVLAPQHKTPRCLFLRGRFGGKFRILFGMAAMNNPHVTQQRNLLILCSFRIGYCAG